MLEKKKHTLLMFQNRIQTLKSKLYFLMIPNGEGLDYLAVKNISIIKRNNIKK